MRKSGHYYKIILLIFFVCPGIWAQKADNWVEVSMTDTMEYAFFGTEHIPYRGYPPSQLFDASFSTCWVSHILNDSIYPSVFIALPENLTNNVELNIFSGYGKSEPLYLKNSRPREIRISLHTALVPDGYVSEYGFLSKTLKSPYQETVFLADTFGVQKISLRNIYEKFEPYHYQALSGYKSHFDFPLLDTLVLVEMEILSIYPGTVYDDICVSEIFFNNSYISEAGITFDSNISNVYVNEDENTLLVDFEDREAISIYSEQDSILQIADIAHDNSWIILISMPGEVGNRVETQYRIIDVKNKEDISNKIENSIPDYIAGEPVYFEQSGEKIYLVLQRFTDRVNRIQLRRSK